MNIEELKDKIARVAADIEHMSSTGGAIQAISTLSSYKEYLEDELKMQERNAASNNQH